MTTAQLRRRAKDQQWHPEMLNGHPDVIPALHPLIMEAIARGLIVTATTDGVHTATSFHYRKTNGKGHAVDIGRSWFSVFTFNTLVRFQRHVHMVHGRKLAELFGPSNRANRKWGKSITLAEGSALENLHDNHVHIAIA